MVAQVRWAVHSTRPRKQISTLAQQSEFPSRVILRLIGLRFEPFGKTATNFGRSIGQLALEEILNQGGGFGLRLSGRYGKAAWRFIGPGGISAEQNEGKEIGWDQVEPVHSVV